MNNISKTITLNTQIYLLLCKKSRLFEILNLKFFIRGVKINGNKSEGLKVYVWMSEKEIREIYFKILVKKMIYTSRLLLKIENLLI